jgi:murein L,D-transpeptidase YcbB/YkuD
MHFRSTIRLRGRVSGRAGGGNGFLRLAVLAAASLLLLAGTLHEVYAGSLWGGTSDEVGAALRERLASPRGAPATAWGEPLRSPYLLHELYRDREFRPFWSDENGPLRKAYDMRRVIRNSYREGLNPENYHAQAVDAALEALKGRPTEASWLADLDLLLTDAVINYGYHSFYGLINPETYELQWLNAGSGEGLMETIRKTLNSTHVEMPLRTLIPSHPHYVKLRQALAEYLELAQTGGWPRVPEGKTLKKRETDLRVPLLRDRLAASGDLEGGGQKGNELFDGALEEAVRRFQGRHGLEADGVVGRRTLEALNVPIEERMRQIALNMDRWRRLRHDLGSRYIIVNISDFSLEVHENGRLVLSMLVVAGKPFWNTPVFSARMTYLVFNPSWHIPKNIITKEVLPNVRQDPLYLNKMDIMVLKDNTPVDPSGIDWSVVNGEDFPYRLVQPPGPSNPLGEVKFMLPNPFAVYLHDTPYRGLFRKTVRAFSHGCIRVEKPLELAEYVLGWSREAILAEIENGTEKAVPLPAPIDVHVVYLTAWVDASGLLQFRPDIYGRDEIQYGDMPVFY